MSKNLPAFGAGAEGHHSAARWLELNQFQAVEIHRHPAILAGSDIDGVHAAAGGRSIRELEEARDAALIRILSARDESEG